MLTRVTTVTVGVALVVVVSSVLALPNDQSLERVAPGMVGIESPGVLAEYTSNVDEEETEPEPTHDGSTGWHWTNSYAHRAPSFSKLPDSNIHLSPSHDHRSPSNYHYSPSRWLDQIPPGWKGQ